jgi:Sulfatase-modifying factor enzyme 1/TIR domain
MRLFVSYARVDRPYCMQIVNTLQELHEVWFDQRMYAGQNWWQEILRRLEWCEGFVYLLSPESVKSEYCRREYELAIKLGKYIFPVLIQSETSVPIPLNELEYADLSKGMTPDAVRILLSSTFMAERNHKEQPHTPDAYIKPSEIAQPLVDLESAIGDAVQALENGDCDRAVFLLKQAKANGFNSRFVKIDQLLALAESALKRQTYLRDAEREYKQIVPMIKVKRTRELGCEAFEAFRRDYPDYDPENIVAICAEAATTNGNGNGNGKHPHVTPKLPFTLPLLDFCHIPSGMVMIDNVQGKHEPNFVEQFKVSKYPITNAQYKAFLDDPDGYDNLSWWQFSEYAHQWRMNNPKPQPERYKGDERPREMVNWYDAMAFCHWLSAQLHTKITLPTQHQWQRAARGEDTRLYPWGNDFNKNCANTKEGELKQTTHVTHYKQNVSLYGVSDMVGNVWEWCLDGKMSSLDLKTEDDRAVMGGAFVGEASRAVIGFHYHLNPKTMFGSIGFRVVQTS